MPSIKIILDAATLFPASLRDILLRLGEAESYEVRWTAEIIEETRRNLVAKGHMNEQQAKHLFEAMRTAFPEALVARADYANTVELMENDAGDRHVLAAAVSCKAQIIVTPNLRHFPKAVLEPLGIKAQSPDEFLGQQFDLDSNLVIQTIGQQADRLKRFVKTRADVLNALEKHAPNTVKKIRQYLLSNPHL